MAFETHLLATKWEAGEYTVVSHYIGWVDIGKLETSGRLADVSDRVTGYIDRAAIVSWHEFPSFLRQTEHWQDQRTLEWYTGLPKRVKFIMIHYAEWESGLGDG
jgi:hypothetical protein